MDAHGSWGSSFSDNIVVWMKKDAGETPVKLEHELRRQGLPVTYLRPLFGTRVWLFRNDRGVPSEEQGSAFTVPMLRGMVEEIRKHRSVRDCRVDIVVPKNQEQLGATSVPSSSKDVQPKPADSTTASKMLAREEL
jgi:hypothetical protein